MAKKKATAKKNTAKPNVYQFKVSLKGTTPLVWRGFLAHEFIELIELHDLIQVTMGWKNCHLYSFEIGQKTYSNMDDDVGFDMGADNKTLDSEGQLLCDVLKGSKLFTYIYDFGDGWVHDVEIVKTLEHDLRMIYPVCIDGDNACPPEDCGGVDGFDELKRVLAGAKCVEQDELLEWLGGYYNPFTFDPNIINQHFLWADI